MCGTRLHDVDGRIGDGARPQVLQQVPRLRAHKADPPENLRSSAGNLSSGMSGCNSC